MTFEERLEELKKDFESKIEELKAEYKEKDKEDNSWKPKFDETYYYIYGTKTINSVWLGGIDDKTLFDIGNVFKTQEEAEFEIERLKVLAEMKKYSKPFDGKAGNFFIGYRYDSPAIHICNYSVIQTNEIYFESEEIVRKVIDEVGADRIKKYYLRVE